MDTAAAAPISLRKYAKRRGVSVQAVSQAVKAGRLSASVARTKDGKLLGIADPEAADREWSASTDPSRGTVAMKERASAGARQEGCASLPRPNPRPLAPPPPSGEPANLSLAEEAAREKYWKAKQARLDYEARSGDLVDALRMRAAVVDAFTRLRTSLLGIPTRAKQQLPHLTTQDVAAVDALVREALEQLADSAPTEQAEAAVA